MDEHIARCPVPRIVDVDGYYPPLHPDDQPFSRRVRRIRKLALVQVGSGRVLHIDYGAEVTPCGIEVAGDDVHEVVLDQLARTGDRVRVCDNCLRRCREQVFAELEEYLLAEIRADEALKQ